MSTSIRPIYFLIGLIVISATFVFFIFQPFLVALVLAGFFAVVLQPIHQRILKYIGNFPGFAAGVTIFISITLFLAPITLISVLVVQDAQGLYTSITEKDGKTYLDTVFQYTDSIIAQYAPGLTLAQVNLSDPLNEYIKSGLEWLVKNIGGALGALAQLLIMFFIFLIALYYLLRDGKKLINVLINASPLNDADDELVFSRMERAVNSVIRGSLTIALIQGTLTGIGFAVFGIPNSALWGVVTAFAALVPGIGTAIVIIPGIAYLFIIGATASGLGLLIWGALAVGLIDNLLGPKLIGRGIQLHPLIVLFSVLGGLAFFGPVGIFLGPIFVSLLFALLSIYPQISKQAA